MYRFVSAQLIAEAVNVTAFVLTNTSKLRESCPVSLSASSQTQPPTPTVAAENLVRVLPWHSMRLASESRSTPCRRHHPFSEHSQPIAVAAAEHSAIEQMQAAN